eukprot:TRINITY_DN29770_c0_g1_i1.p1 TRINITY_DN29770_c0_g1~~TRINITY_DN29770_c0_g1_i1.p1  ORF type:complete len:220 (-),score=28.82 TRINITY_DN29770_c0_g1_i1:369-1028(-)
MPEAASAVGAVASALTVTLFLSPLKVIWDIRTKKTTGDQSPLPFLAMLVNCVVWFLYGVELGDATLLPPNFLGMATGSLAVLVFLKFSDIERRSSLLTYCGYTVCLLLSILMYLFLLIPTEVRTLQIGLLAVIFSICMFASPLSSMAQAIRDRDPTPLPLPLLVPSAASTAMWSVYGSLTENTFIITPNVLGLALSVLQLAVYVGLSLLRQKAVASADK